MLKFPYTLWRDLVSDASGVPGGSQGHRFHTPYGVTSFRTYLYTELAIQALEFPYALWRDLVSDCYRRSSETRTGHGAFPYALWRDLVSDPTPVNGVVTSADATGLHRPLRTAPHWPAGNPSTRPFVLVNSLHR
jgi:hypothetical protein